MTTSIVALQSEATPGILFEFTLPGGLATRPTSRGSSGVATAWPIFDAGGGEVDLASLALSSQSTMSGAWGPATRGRRIAAAAPQSGYSRGSGATGGLPLVLWPHTAAPPPPPGPGPGPGPKKKWGCRVVAQGTTVTLNASKGGYDAYTEGKDGVHYDEHRGEYCGTHPEHAWAYTADVGEAACQSKCDELTCPCFDVLTHPGTGTPTAAATAPVPPVPRAVAMAPLANFMAAGADDDGGEVAYGLFGSVATAPAGFRHATMLVAGRGVAATLGAVGSRLLARGGKARTTLQHPTDLSLTSLGYWTDNGAWYHYLCSECCGGGGSQGSCPCPAECGGNTTMQEVMLEVKADWAARKIPAKYFMFDSWWYQKDGDPPPGTTAHPWPVRSTGGVIEWVPEAQVFPAGLTDWLGKPTFLHNRCFSTANRYLDDPRFRDSFLCNEQLCMPTDVELFKHIMAEVQPWQPFVYVPKYPI